MSKTYRKEKPQSPRRSERYGDKDITHDHDRSQRRKVLHEIQHHWDGDDLDDYAEPLD